MKTQALVLNQYRVELRNTLKNGEQLLLLAVVPAAVYLIGAQLEDRQAFVKALVTGLLAANFTSIAIATGFERRWGVLKSYATSPLSLSHVAAAKALSAASISLMQWMVLSVVSQIWSPRALLAVIVAPAVLAPWAFFMATTMRAERVLALSNLLFMLMVGALWTSWPVALLLPSGVLLSIAAEKFLLGVMLGTLWFLGGAFLAVRHGRWSE